MSKLTINEVGLVTI